MELRDFIERGEKKAGSVTALGVELCLSREQVSMSKGQKRPLPIDSCVKLADYIGADLRDVIAANELVSEKKEEKRQFWRSFLDTAKAASIALAIASVTNFVTPSTANALPSTNSGSHDLYYVKSRLQRHRKQGRLTRTILPFIERMKKALFSFSSPQIAEMQTI